MWDDWGSWKQWARWVLSGSATLLSSPWHDSVRWKLSPANEMEGKRRPPSTTDSENSRFRHVRSQTNGTPAYLACAHTHIWEDGGKKETTQMEGQPEIWSVSHSRASRPLYHSVGTIQKSTWLKLDLSTSAQTVSVTGGSFSPDWRRGVTLVIVTDSLRRMYAHPCT